jgi:hypothetical protein
MTLYLRNEQNRTIVDIELYKKNNYVELSSSIDIENYSNYLLNNLNRKNEIISDFNDLSELRGWLWEVFLGDDNTADKYDETLEEVRKMLKKYANKHNLYYVED